MKKYKTEQRKFIENYLLQNKNKFFNAEEIYEYLLRKNIEVGLTTIYRYLNILEQENRVRVILKNHTKYFQFLVTHNSNHLFLKCSKCGKFMDLDCKEFENISKHIMNEHKFKLDENIVITGICDSCSK